MVIATRRYWIMKCPVCSNRYIVVNDSEGNRIIGTPCEHQEDPHKKEEGQPS